VKKGVDVVEVVVDTSWVVVGRSVVALVLVEVVVSSSVLVEGASVVVVVVVVVLGVGMKAGLMKV